MIHIRGPPLVSSSSSSFVIVADVVKGARRFSEVKTGVANPPASQSGKKMKFKNIVSILFCSIEEAVQDINILSVSKSDQTVSQ